MTRDMGMTRRHSSRITNLLGCVFILEHCTALRWRVAHTIEGYYILQVQGASEEMACHRGCFRRKPNCGFDFVMYTCIRVLEF